LDLGGTVHDAADPAGRQLSVVLGLVADFEAALNRGRTIEGMNLARVKGRLKGKPPELRPRQEAHLVALFEGGEHTTTEIAELMGVSRSTVYRAVKRAQARQSRP
jgi:DNA invertase Pin-like site-specific DNA recombinase